MDFVQQRLVLLALACAYVVLERVFPERKAPLLRRGWVADVLHLLFTELGTNALILVVIVVLMPVLQWVKWTAAEAWLASLPYLARLALAVVVIDVVGYWSHRAQHAIPLLWRFHQLHHSSRQLDWLAGVRRHPVDEAFGRLCLFTVLVVCGFGIDVLGGAAGLIGLWVGLLHANVRFRFSRVRGFLVTPDHHHWHHAWHTPDLHPHGVNFATFFPVLDRLFGTYHLPDHRPVLYGHAEPTPEGYVAQLKAPFR